LDLYFSRPKSNEAYQLLPMVCALPWTSLQPRVEAEAVSPRVVRRRAAALAVVRSSFRGRRKLLERLRRDSDRDVSSLAAWHLSHENAAV
jgi:hypothetical protein